MSEIIEFRADLTGLRENAQDALARSHGLYIVQHELIGEIDSDIAPLVEVDVEFARRTPNLPIENVASRLDNYNPTNDSQIALKNKATQLAIYRNPLRMAGLIACGPAGIGKTHIAVGVAKHAMLTGQEATYINAPSARVAKHNLDQLVEKTDVFVIDDLNSPYENFGATIFPVLLAAMHDKGGGKILVTSNYDNPNKLMKDIISVSSNHSPAAGQRLADRIASALLGLQVEGDSYRRQVAMDQVPWFEEQSLEINGDNV